MGNIVLLRDYSLISTLTPDLNFTVILFSQTVTLLISHQINSTYWAAQVGYYFEQKYILMILACSLSCPLFVLYREKITGNDRPQQKICSARNHAKQPFRACPAMRGNDFKAFGVVEVVGSNLVTQTSILSKKTAILGTLQCFEQRFSFCV